MKSKKTLKLLLALILFLFTSALGIRGLSGKDESNVPQPIIPTPFEEKTYQVSRIIDGDTIEIENGQKVRLIGVDTPELDDKDPVKKCYAQKAKEKTQELLENKIIKMERDVSSTDKYQRLLRYIWVDDIFLNDYLVRNGFAMVATFPPDVKYQKQFQQAQQEAMEKKMGFWGETLCQE